MDNNPNQVTIIANLDALVSETPQDSIVSRTFYKDGDVRAILFAFAPGEMLSEHTASVPAILHFLSGTAVLTVGDQTTQAGPGTWVHMAANTPHSIAAQDEVKMLLLLLP
jgi:quercetin dioxygenase-like cupin family protein